MPIIDTDTVKSILGISETTYDTQIATIIPYIQNWIIKYLNNRFLDNYVRMESSTLCFNSGTPAKITDSSELFISDGDVLTYFYSGMDLDIHGTYRNDKIVSVETVEESTLTLSSGHTLIDEDAELNRTYVLLTRVNWDDGIKPVIADMIYYKLDNKRFLKSWGLADWTQVNMGDGGYPVELLKQLRPWKKLKWG